MSLRWPCVKMEALGKVPWLLLSLSLLVASCSKPPAEPVSQATPPPTPAVTPHPAAGAREAAVKMYPALAVKDSTFNKTFRDLFEDQSKRNPYFLARPEWPLDLAQRTAGILGVVPSTPEPKVTPTPLPVIMPAPTPTALNRGPYDERRSHGEWVDQYGVRHYY